MGGVIEMLTENLERYKGKFFYSHTVTGTAVSSHATCQTRPPNPLKAFMIITNSATKDNSSSANTIVIPTYIRFNCNTVGTGGTDSEIVLIKDTIDRYSSGGTAFTTNQTRAGQDGSGAVTQTTAKAVSYWGPIVTASASAAKEVGRCIIHPKSAAFIAGDSVEITFGDFNHGGQNSATVLVQKYAFGMQPVFIEPQCCLIVCLMSTAQTASGKYDIQFGHIEIKNGSTY